MCKVYICVIETIVDGEIINSEAWNKYFLSHHNAEKYLTSENFIQDNTGFYFDYHKNETYRAWIQELSLNE